MLALLIFAPFMRLIANQAVPRCSFLSPKAHSTKYCSAVSEFRYQNAASVESGLILLQTIRSCCSSHPICCSSFESSVSSFRSSPLNGSHRVRNLNSSGNTRADCVTIVASLASITVSCRFCPQASSFYSITEVLNLPLIM